MGLEYLKRWHWMIIGLIVGAMFGGTRLMWRDADPGGERSYDRLQFSDMIRRGMQVRKLVLHPPIDGQEWVTGEALKYKNGTFSNQPVRRAKKWWQFMTPATQPAKASAANEGTWVPFPMLAADKNSNRPIYQKPPTAVEFMADLQKQYPRLKDALVYKTAWWEATSMTIGIYSLGGFVLIGLIWPTVSNLLAGAGFGNKRPKEDYDLSRFKSEPEPQKAAASVVAGSSALDDLNAKLEAEVADMFVTKTAIEQENEEEEAAIKQLRMDAVETPVEKADREAREYKGEFYPVVKPAVHKDVKK